MGITGCISNMARPCSRAGTHANKYHVVPTKSPSHRPFSRTGVNSMLWASGRIRSLPVVASSVHKAGLYSKSHFRSRRSVGSSPSASLWSVHGLTRIPIASHILFSMLPILGRWERQHGNRNLTLLFHFNSSKLYKPAFLPIQFSKC